MYAHLRNCTSLYSFFFFFFFFMFSIFQIMDDNTITLTFGLPEQRNTAIGVV